MTTPPPPESVAFAFVDVFAARPLTGNPLAVVPDADALTVAQMQAIAREFNQSETTFLLAAERPGVAHRLRSFTAAGAEVGGAGHNALGAWLWLAHAGRLGASPEGTWTQQIADDVLEVTISRDGAAWLVSMHQSPPRFGAIVDDVDPFAAALGLAPDDLDRSVPAQVVSTGAGHLLVPVVSRDVLDRVRVDTGALRSLLQRAGGEGCYVYWRAPDDDQVDAYARFFNPTMGIAEDPATGTAAGPLAALLVRDRGATRGDVVVAQGHALGRPSLLRVAVDGERVVLTGSGLVVGEGRLAL